MNDAPTPTRLPHGTDLDDALAALSSDGSETVRVAGGVKPDGATGEASSRFEPLKPLAQGGLGRVSVAFDGQLKREVALKEIRPDRRGVEVRRRFIAEAEITGQLEHPGIVPIYALERDSFGEPRYAMRLIEGQTLSDAIRAYHEAPTPLRFRELLQRFISICQTVAYAHSKGVIHRDLKPANVMLGAYGETLVVDWGLAKKLSPEGESKANGCDFKVGPAAVPTDSAGDSTIKREPGATARPDGLTQDGDILGTPTYMSPEQAEGQLGQVGPAADLYSLGAIFYELLAGKPPFQGSAFVVIEAVRTGQVKPPSQVKEVPRALEAVCLKAMAKEPGERYPTALALAQEVERYLADEPTLAYAEPWSVRAQRWLRRNRALAIGAAAALLVALVSSGIGLAIVGSVNRELSTANQKLLAEEAKTREALGAEQLRRRQAYRYLEDLTSDLLGDAAVQQRQAKLTDRQRESIKRSIAAFGEIAASAGGDRAGRLAQAKALNRVGMLRHRFGEGDEAVEAIEAGIAALKALLAEQPGDAELIGELADGYGNLGRALASQRKLKASHDAERESVRLRETLLEGPRTPELLGELAQGYANLALAEEDAGNDRGAKAHYAKATAYAKDAFKLDPRNGKLLHTLSVIDANQCTLHLALGELDEAAKIAERSAALVEPVLAKGVADLDLIHDLAVARNNLGSILHEKGDLKAAWAEMRKAQAHYERLLQSLPAEPTYRRGYAETLHNQGVIQRDAGKPAESVAHFKDAIAKIEPLTKLNPDDLDSRRTLARCLHRLADHHEKANEFDEALAYRHRGLEEDESCRKAGDLTPPEEARLASLWMELALLHARRDEEDEALAAYARTRELLRKLLVAHPQRVQEDISLAGAQCNEAAIWAKRDPTKMPPLLDDAQARLEKVLKKQPADARARAFLGNVWEVRARWFDHQKDAAAAAAARKKAVELHPALGK